jgi:hypothetical protein
MMQHYDAWVIRRLLVGHNLNGELRSVSEPFQPLAEELASLSSEERQGHLEAFRRDRPDSQEIILALADADPDDHVPEPSDAESTATLADVRRVVAESHWPWVGWLTSGVLHALAADPGTGKTIMTFDLVHRLYFERPWPDGQPPSMPKGTRTLWVPGDRHFVQLTELASRFGLPDEALLLNAPQADPTIGLDLDDPDELAALRRRIQAKQPGLVIVDTVGMTTARNLCRPEDARAYFGPLMDLAQLTGIPILLLTHLSRDAQALGRRIVGACRLVWKMTQPDPDGQPDRRRVWVDKTYTLKPPALGMTIAGYGCSFDSNPPSAPTPSTPGRPSVKCEAAIAFLTEQLSDGDRKQCELVELWLEKGEAKGTIFNAIEAMQADGRMVIDDTAKPKLCHLVRNPSGGQEPSF